MQHSHPDSLAAESTGLATLGPEGQELNPKRKGQITGAVVMEKHQHCQNCETERPGMGMRSLDLSLLHPDLSVRPTGNQELTSMG